MLWFAVAFLLLGWIIALLSSFTLGGYIHVLVLVAVILVLARVLRGPKEEVHQRGSGIQPKFRKP